MQKNLNMVNKRRSTRFNGQWQLLATVVFMIFFTNCDLLLTNWDNHTGDNNHFEQPWNVTTVKASAISLHIRALVRYCAKEAAS